MKTLLSSRTLVWFLALVMGAIGCGKKGGGGGSVGQGAGDQGANLAGYWVGSLDLGPTSLSVGFDLIPTEPNKFRVAFDSLDQGVKDLPATASLEGSKLTLELDLKQGGLAKYVADLSADGKTMAGTWRQGPGSMPLEMKRGDRATAIAEADPIRKLSPEEVPLNKAAAEKLEGEWKGVQMVWK